jgi:peptide/nickel transport system substrate-binding protein
MKGSIYFPLVVAWLAGACAAPPVPTSSTSLAPAEPARSARTLIAAVQSEPKALSPRIIGSQVAVSLNFSKRMFNADLTLLDDQSNPSPYLAEALPRLHSDSWKVFPDGRMETTYRLKPNLVWHDGTPHTADDLVFSWEVYSTPDVGQSGSPPMKFIANVEAPDPQTVLIHWSQPYWAAGILQGLGTGSTGLPPLPRAILGSALESGAHALFNHPYWTSGYVGLGPYRLDRWEPGAFLEGSAFDRHALGPPKIQRIKLMFIPDPNTVLAGVLAGEIQVTADNALPLAQATTLMRQWPTGGGVMVPGLSLWQGAHIQGRPEFVSPTALRDARVRQALAYAVDKIGINEALYDGQNPIADSVFPATSDIGRAADAAVTKYRYDLGRSAQLMAEVGLTKRSDDFFVGPDGERFSFETRTGTVPNVELQTVLAAGWRKAGFDVQELVVPTAQWQDVQVKSTNPGIVLSPSGAGPNALNSMGSANITRAENQFRGSNWGGYSNPELDRLIAAFGAALEPADQARVAVDFVKLYGVELPAIPLFFPIFPWVFTSDVSGPRVRPAEGNIAWNIHEWELR